MKRWIVLSLLLVPLLASAAAFWDGNAALQRGDASFESGLYATSNSFPAGTQITIQNQDTGKTVTATITGRIEGQSGILVLLSPKTAEALGLAQGTLGRVRVTVPNRAYSDSSAQPGDKTFSSDPDVNPAAAYSRPGTAGAAAVPSEETLPAATPATTAPVDATLANTTPAASPEAPAEEHPATPQTTTTVSATPDSTSTAASTAQSKSTTEADNASIIAAAQSRVPQKQVFQPPREDQKFAYRKPATEPSQTAAQSGTPTITAVVGEPGVSPAAPPATDLALADVAAPEESRPEEIVGADSAAPPPAAALPQVALASPDLVPEEQAGQSLEPVQTEVTGPAAVPPEGHQQPKMALLPPEAPATTTLASAGTNTSTTTTTTTTTKQVAAAAAQKSGAPANFFLQLAAYGTEKNARDLADKLTPTYPAIVLAPSSPKSSVFKVVIGPLNRAESGTLLTWFRYRGFPDAFVKQE